MTMFQYIEIIQLMSLRKLVLNFLSLIIVIVLIGGGL
jgi:hypothetical protein